jgi:hypothetical protein
MLINFNPSQKSKIHTVVFTDIRAVNMIVCWYRLLFQFSNFEFPNLAIYLDAGSLQIQIIHHL